MKWLWLALAIVLGALVGAALLSDPGYVLVRVGEGVFESTIAAAVLAVVLLLLTIYSLSFLLRRLLQSLGLLGRWRAARRQDKQTGSWRRSVVAFAAADWYGAAKALEGAAVDDDRRLEAILVRAWHMQQSGDEGALEKLLEQTAHDHAQLLPQLKLSLARWQLQSAAPAQALDLIGDLSPSTERAGLYAWACIELGRWQALASHWTEVDKYNVLKAEVFRQQMATLRAGKAMADAYAGQQSGDIDWQLGFKSLPKQWRADANTLELLAGFLVAENCEAQARQLLQHALGKKWQVTLVRRFGLLRKTKPLGGAIEQAQRWLKERSDDPEVQLALARLLRADTRPEEARRHLLAAAKTLRSGARQGDEIQELTEQVLKELGQLALLAESQY